MNVGQILETTSGRGRRASSGVHFATPVFRWRNRAGDQDQKLAGSHRAYLRDNRACRRSSAPAAKRCSTTD
ncbi:MAG: hypothetical protein WKF84_24240 [Pyrinomonadaceae bacterium]